MVSFFQRRLRLLREQLHDELLLHRDLDVLPDRQPAHRSPLLVGVQLEPRWNRRPASGQIVRDALLHLGAGPKLDPLAHLDDVGGNGNLAPADLDVTVGDHLPRLAPGGRHAQPEHHVVQAPLEEFQEILARHALLGLGPGEVASKLGLEHAIDPLGLLLFPQLHAVGRGLAAAEPVLAWRVVPALDGALLGEAARALEKELDPLAPALPAYRDVISCQRPTLLYMDRRGPSWPPPRLAPRLRRRSRRSNANSSALTPAGPYTRRRLGGRQPLCGIGVTSRMAVISSPTACSDRMAASRPDPGPRTYTSTCLSPSSMALRAAFSAAVWAAKGVLFREPLKPALPALAQDTTLPILSVRVTIVLLKVAWTWAMPTRTSLRSRRRPPFRGVAAGFCSGASAMLAAPYLFAPAAGAPAAATGLFLTMTPLLRPLRVRAFVCVRWPRTGRPLRWRM